MRDEEKSKVRMPVLFVGHGSPMNAIKENDFTAALKNLGSNLPRPKAILMVSAHWETDGTFVTAMERPKTVHDFYGFPQELFDVQYPAAGAPALAREISQKIPELNIGLDLDQWGLDHGTWAVLKHIFPQADIPVIQLSLDKSKPMAFHLEAGEKLKFLRDEGVMIMGSGNIVHNLREIGWSDEAKPHDWAIEFDQWAKKKILERDFHSLASDPLESRAGKLSIPTWDHYLPMLYILGASGPQDTLSFDYEGIQNSSMSMRSFRFSNS